MSLARTGNTKTVTTVNMDELVPFSNAEKLAEAIDASAPRGVDAAEAEESRAG